MPKLKHYKKNIGKKRRENIFTILLDFVVDITLIVGFVIAMVLLFLPLLWKERRVGELYEK